MRSAMALSSLVPIVTAEAPIRVLEPKIIWPTMVLNENGYVEGDLQWFPEEDSYRQRFDRGIGRAMSRAFRDAVRIARHRVWLLDEQLLRDDQSTERLCELFHETGASDLRVVTASREGAHDRARRLKDFGQGLRRRTSGTPPQIKIYLNFNKSSKAPDVHDRFAVIDDVLWHCGATVAGLHNAINAMSFGWCARQTRAEEFFLRLCSILDESDD
jgi:hypothetical protein